MNSQGSRIKRSVCASVRKAVQLLGTTLGVLLISFPLLSQGNAGRILGDITDQSGGAVAGAAVTVTDVQRGISRTVIAGESGGPIG